MAKYLALCLAVAGLCLAPEGTARSAAPQSDEVYAAEGFGVSIALGHTDGLQGGSLHGNGW